MRHCSLHPRSSAPAATKGKSLYTFKLLLNWWSRNLAVSSSNDKSRSCTRRPASAELSRFDARLLTDLSKI